ncbi:YbgA family protein [Geobacillus thermocatenulatus]|uniref:YbgA family protein n=1 Tax=Geobacillus thermocatenulatus TaxID=33938 RepID=UPI000473667A|nr:DUF523 and DUF1722 domain-containing protein [Geobacillus thermocatenulatus]
MHYAIPTVVVSECLGFSACRYNGDIIHNSFVFRLGEFARLVPVCPEVAIGLGVPRETVRLVKHGEEKRLVQPSANRDWTKEMKAFAASFFDQIGEIDGFILKSRSPTCGIKDVKVYGDADSSMVIEKGAGLFADHVFERFPQAVVEEEGRLTNAAIREHFLTKLFSLALFREVKAEQSMKALVQFHSEHKYLLMAYSQTWLKQLGRLVANRNRLPVEQVLDQYEQGLHMLFARAPQRRSHVNVCQHLMGYFKNEMSAKEKQYVLELLGQYRAQQLPLSSVTSVLKSWAIREENEYLLQQRYFAPYPPALLDVRDSGKGRETAV